MTEQGVFGANIDFPDGLVVLHADNSNGKSTCIRSIIYALGLERMFGPGKEPPLPPAMLTEIRYKGEELPVLESYVYLEISNSRGESWTIKRKAAGEGSPDRRLVNVWFGPSLTNPEQNYKSNYYFLRDPGTSSRESGFHFQLERFIGWELPEVSKFDGNPSKLFMEMLLPLFYVEQRQGWSTIQATTPKYFQIKDGQKRSIEFLLSLDIYSNELEKQSLLKQENRITSEWNEIFARCVTLVHVGGGRIQGLPSSPTYEWPPTIQPSVELYRNNGWMDWAEVVGEDYTELDYLQSKEIPTVDQVASDLSSQLSAALQTLSEQESAFRNLSQEANIEEEQIAAIRMRLQHIEEDLKRNLDIRKLKSFGAFEDLSVESGLCPTCLQDIDDSLFEQSGMNPVMTIDANIAFIQSQKSTFLKMLENSEVVHSSKVTRLEGMSGYLSELRASVRAIKQSLISDGRQPSIEAIRQVVIIENRIQRNEKMMESFLDITKDFANLATEWTSVQARLRRLGTVRLSVQDVTKLHNLRTLVREQARQYNFLSFPVDSIDIEYNTYQPNRTGFDIVFDISASDNIRIILSYVIGLLELSRHIKTNHPGILILDEPRQQSLDPRDFAQLLKRLTESKKFNQQVILATSEPIDRLENIIENLDVKYIKFDSLILNKESIEDDDLPPLKAPVLK